MTIERMTTEHQPMCHPRDYPGRDVYAVIGNPIAHSRSPEIHTEFAKQTDQAIHYGKIYSPIEDFKKTVQTFFAEGGAGLNVTVPFKLAAFEMAQELSARAKAAQAVNILYQKDGRLYGDNSDGVGLVRDLKSSGCAIQGKRILLLGAGGAAQGVIQPLLEERPALLMMSNRSQEKVEKLKNQFEGIASEQHVVLATCPLADVDRQEGFDVVINATASGLQASSPIQDKQVDHLVREGAFVYDMVYGKATPFLLQFQNLPVKTLDGLGMLVEQAAQAFEIWRGERLKRALDTRAVLQHLRQG